MTRSLQQIIESEQSPTDEEWARLQRCVDAWYEARVDRIAEYIQQHLEIDRGGYMVELMLTSPKPPVEDVRGWYHQYKDSPALKPGTIEKILCDITRFAD